MGCPSDRWFFGSVFVFLVAVGMLAGGAVNMQLASDDPRTPRVKSYDGYVDAWQNTYFAEYNTKYTSVPATATLTRGADAEAGSTTTVSAWTKLESGDIAAIGLKDTRSDYKRHSKHLALYASITNFHSTSKKSEKKNDDVTVAIGSNVFPKFHVYECDTPKYTKNVESTNAEGEKVTTAVDYWKVKPKFLTRINFVEANNGGSGVSTLTRRKDECDDLWTVQSETDEYSTSALASAACSGNERKPNTNKILEIVIRSPMDPVIKAMSIDSTGCARDFGPTAGEYEVRGIIFYAVAGVCALGAFYLLERSRRSHGWKYPMQDAVYWSIFGDPDDLRERQGIPFCCYRIDPPRVFDTKLEEICFNINEAIAEGKTKQIMGALLYDVTIEANNEGMLRDEYIRERVVEAFNRFGYGVLQSKIAETIPKANPLRHLLDALLTERFDFEAQVIHDAMKGWGCDEDTLTTILCTLDEEDIFKLQNAYSSRFEKSLEAAMLSETEGKYKRVLLLAGCDGVAEAYAKVCHSAIHMMGTDCKALIRIMVTCSHQVMYDTRKAYGRLYNLDLAKDMEGEWAIGGDFKNILCALVKKHPDNIETDPDYDADIEILRNAVEGMGTDEEAIIGVLRNKTEEQLQLLQRKYDATHCEDLKLRLKSETTGIFESEGFRNTLMGLLTNREEQIAVYLKEAFDGWFSNDDWGLISMLIHRTPEEKTLIREAYTMVHGRDLIQDIRANCKGEYEKALVALVAPRARTYARGIKLTAKGWLQSTNQSGLIALLTHKDVLMKGIRAEFQKESKGNTHLTQFLRNECSGEFERALVNIAEYTPPNNYTASNAV